MKLDQTLRDTILKAVTDHFTEKLKFTKSLKLMTTVNVVVDCSTHFEYVASDEIKRYDALPSTKDDVQTVSARDSTLNEMAEKESLDLGKDDDVSNDETQSNVPESEDLDTFSSSPEAETAHLQGNSNELLEASITVTHCPLCFEEYPSMIELSSHLTTTHKKYCDDEFKCLMCSQDCLKVEMFVKHWLDKHGYMEGCNAVIKILKRKNGGKQEKKTAKSLKKTNTIKKIQTHMDTSKRGLKIRIKQTNANSKDEIKTSKNTKSKTKNERFDDVKTESISETLNDRKTETVRNPNECEHCGKTYMSKRALRRHCSVTHANELLSCDVCHKTFKSKEGLYHHRRGLHSDVKAFQCSFHGCDASFNYSHSLKLHKLKHTGSRPHKCNVCEKTYLTSYHLKVHYNGVHVEKKGFTCKTCGKGFSYSTSLRVHEATHSQKSREVCNVCGKTFVNTQALKYHCMSKHTEPGHFQCQKCDKVYKSEILLKAHERRHTADNNRFMCDLCGRRYMYKSALEMHKSVHYDKKAFACKICQKAFKTYATLYSHMFVHREDSSFACETCGKAFKTKERMKAHARRHAGTKPFECQICHKRFPDNGGLSKHTRTVHCPVKKFVCSICGKSTTRADNLRVHMKVHAKSNVTPTMSVEPAKVSEPIEDLPGTIPLVIDEGSNTLVTAKKQRKPRAPNKPVRQVRTLIPQHVQNEGGTSGENQPFHANMPHFSTIDSSQISSSLPCVKAQYQECDIASPVNGIPAHIANENVVVITNDLDKCETTSSVTLVPSTVTSGTISVTPMQPVNYMYPWPYVLNQAQQQGLTQQSFYQQ